MRIRVQKTRERRQDKNGQSCRQQDFPSHFHKLIKPVTRERATIPDIEVHERGNFDREPVNVLNANENCRNEHYQTDQAQQAAKSGQTHGLKLEVRMSRHARDTVKAYARKKEECDSGE